MNFELDSIGDCFADYVNENFGIKIINYYGDQQPIGGIDQGVNLDEGEVHSFDLEYSNNGNLGIDNVICQVSCIHGKLSQSFSGLADFAGSQWISPWSSTIVVRPFNVGPRQTVVLRHEMSGGHLFGYRLDETTGGSDNHREIETLLTARLSSWQPDLKNLILEPGKNAPEGIFKSFIQRT